MVGRSATLAAKCCDPTVPTVYPGGQPALASQAGQMDLAAAAWTSSRPGLGCTGSGRPGVAPTGHRGLHPVTAAWVVHGSPLPGANAMPIRVWLAGRQCTTSGLLPGAATPLSAALAHRTLPTAASAGAILAPWRRHRLGGRSAAAAAAGSGGLCPVPLLFPKAAQLNQVDERLANKIKDRPFDSASL